MTKIIESGYRPCACRDCMEIAIGEPGAFCIECEDAGCEGDGECQVGPDAEPEPAEEARQTALATIQGASAWIVTEGSSDPRDVLARLVGALAMLSPSACLQLEALRAIPQAALDDELHPYWVSVNAAQVLDALMAALQRHAPPGFEFAAEGNWFRLGFFRCS